MNLIAELQAARKRQGLKQQELAERAGLSRMTVQRIESGAIDPRLSTLVEMARVLGLALVTVASEGTAATGVSGASGPAQTSSSSAGLLGAADQD